MRVAAVIAALCLVGAGCGDDDEPAPPPPAPQSGFAEALRTVSTGVIPIGVGYGYMDLEALRPAEYEWAAGALGPGGSLVVSHAGEIAPQTGFDPTRARRLVSVAASYTLGVRADGLDPAPMRRRLAGTADSKAREGDWEFLDFGVEWSVPNDTAAEPLSGMGARLALGDDAVVVARTDRARAELTTPSDEVLTDPAVRLVLECLGDPVAARIVPNNFTHAPNTGPQLLGFGVADPADGPVRETLCVADPGSERVDAAREAMESNLAEEAEDPVTNERIGNVADSVEIDALEGDGAVGARAVFTLSERTPPGYLFRAFVHGSLITYIGLIDPPGAQ